MVLWRKLSDERLHSVALVNKYVSFQDETVLRKRLQSMIDFLDQGGEAGEALEQAIDYLGFEISTSTSAGAEEDDVTYFVRPPASTYSLLPKDGVNAEDFFAHLRELDNAMSHLRHDIRAINDPDRITSDIKAVRAYLDAFREFLDVFSDQRPDEVPAALPVGLANKLYKVDWWKVSDSAQKWASTVGELISKLF